MDPSNPCCFLGSARCKIALRDALQYTASALNQEPLDLPQTSSSSFRYLSKDRLLDMGIKSKRCSSRIENSVYIQCIQEIFSHVDGSQNAANRLQARRKNIPQARLTKTGRDVLPSQPGSLRQEVQVMYETDLFLFRFFEDQAPSLSTGRCCQISILPCLSRRIKGLAALFLFVCFSQERLP